MSLSYRVAEERDLLPIMALYQKFGSTFTEDPLFLDYEKLKVAVCSKEASWIISERGSELAAVISILHDRSQGIAKISRMMVNPDLTQSQHYLKISVENAIDYLQKNEPQIDVVYSTTLTLPLQLQEVTLEAGFHVMGVFPNAAGVDQSRLNGLTVFYMPGVLENKRHREFSIFQPIAPFFKLAQSALKLPPVESVDSAAASFALNFEPLPQLERIEAPLLVDRKFEKLKTHQSMAVNFYPFLRPNCLISDPDQSVEIYLKTIPALRFAAIIGEHLERSVNPVSLYNSVNSLLRASGISYVEVINDAADIYGTNCIMEAGFTPCAYIPAFKKQGSSRRDYVVYGKSFEYGCRPPSHLRPEYLAFFKQYFRLERRNYLMPK